MKRSIVWFRNDLRLADQKALTSAIAQNDEVIPVYVFDQKRWRTLDLGFTKTGAFQTQFILESVAELKQNLQNLGSDLVVRVGDPAEVIPQLARDWNASSVYASKEATWEELQQEQAMESALLSAGKTMNLFWQSTLFHEDDIPWPIQHLPDIFTDFRKENEKSTPIHQTLPKPDQIITPKDLDFGTMPGLTDFGLKSQELDERVVLKMNGGETQAWKRLEEYFWKADELKNYKWTRNGLLGTNYSSKFSPWLAHGCISPRSIYEEVQRYEKERKKNVSTYWMVFELIWRDYFRFVAKKYGSTIFQLTGIKNQAPEMSHNMDAFEKWRKGETGVPFIDANMRELKMTGFMSNRGRQNVASFLVKDLGVDWRWGAAWFESQLIDYDVCSNWGNWMYVAGVGNDPRPNRYFNILSQARKYDTNGEYIRHWIPEIAGVEGGQVHEPVHFKNFGVAIGKDYPEPIVDMSRW